ncbi:hypothetical protein [Bacillus sp. SRB3LM]|uniref:hypothetical protein n=1 Tax=Bacillus sp. SRB3LM TaxID=2608689 RepID=UPI0018C39927|nr:hypothetical protein [Bacillus sp. SRB3LM]MBG0971308.1 hypothetical protein [Bacillus sp. SRB3LM]
MKMRKNKTRVIPGILVCCSFMMTNLCAVAVLSTGENIIHSSKQFVDASSNQLGSSTLYQYIL